ncbi:MAG: hypothetical protein KGL39_10255 [Patescibacteria group bacterium]|nr:hypothetical protein [Patescibacteria group bacterium]
MAIKFACYRGIGWISEGIKMLTYSQFSHIGILFSEDLTVDVNGKQHFIAAGNVIEAWQGGVKLSESLSSRHTKNTPVDLFSYEHELNRMEEYEAGKFLVRNLGKKYAYLNVAYFIPIVRVLFPNPPDRWYDRTHVFCSELAVELSFHINRPLFKRCKAFEIPPRDIPRNPLLRYEKTVYTE